MTIRAFTQEAHSDPARIGCTSGGAGLGNEHEAAAVPCVACSDVRLRRARGLSWLRAGFTLIELLIGVAILAVLAGLAVAGYTKYYDSARVAQAASDIRNLDVVINQYFADHNQYPDSLADIGKAGMLDPWKHPYQYLKLFPFSKKLTGQSRKDKNLVPINSDFDLYSMGKDGQSVAPLTSKVSRDDVVRASNGRFVGLASDY